MRRAARRENFEAVSASESLRLTMIVCSSAFIALAGNYARSSAEAPTIALPMTEQTSVQNEKSKPQLIAFADGEIMHFEEKLAQLVERAEMKNLASSPGYRQELALNLNRIHDKIDAARSSLLRLSQNRLNEKTSAKAKSERKFLEEDLRADLFALQETWDISGSRVVALLEETGLIYVRNVSVTGQ